MRDLGGKMAELKFEAPLAQFEETDEWGPIDYQSSSPNANNLKSVISDTLSLHLKSNHQNDNNIFVLDNLVNGTSGDDNVVGGGGGGDISNENNDKKGSPNCNSNNGGMGGGDIQNINNDNVDNFTETISGSLEDLVNTFDDKITKCFGNYEKSVEELAPVQIRTQEEIMNECQMWWTITGNFGNILPIDWSKSYTRQMHMPTLKLNERPAKTPDDELNDLSSEDEAVANDLDMHALILNGLNTDNDRIKTAEEVIKEIDDIMDEDEIETDDIVVVSEAMEKAKEVLGSPFYEEKLNSMTISQLNELYMEMEILIREFSETLISELALRDELEYEKELKNTFISLLLAVQNRRRQFHVEKKRGKSSQGKTSSGPDPKYLTTVIPYHLDSTPPDNQTLQILIKILKAINEDSPTVPTLLTDYILKVLCPK